MSRTCAPTWGLLPHTMVQRAQALVLCLWVCLLASAPVHGAPGAPARVVTLAPHITELMYAAGAGDALAGTVNSSDWPAQTESLPRVGDGLNVNTEVLLSLQPTDVLAWQSGGAALVLQPLLQRLGIRLSYIQPNRVDDIPDQIQSLGQRFGTLPVAQPAAQSLRQTLAELRTRYADAPRVSVLIEIGQTPPYTLGNDPLTNNALSYCGATNLYGHTTAVAPQIQQEYVLAAQPDMVLVPSNDPNVTAQVRAHWAALGLQAARNGHVYGVGADTFLRPGPRLIKSLETVCQAVDTVRKLR